MIASQTSLSFKTHSGVLEVFSRNALYKFTFYITLHAVSATALNCILDVQL